MGAIVKALLHLGASVSVRVVACTALALFFFPLTLMSASTVINIFNAGTATNTAIDVPVYFGYGAPGGSLVADAPAYGLPPGATFTHSFANGDTLGTEFYGTPSGNSGTLYWVGATNAGYAAPATTVNITVYFYTSGPCETNLYFSVLNNANKPWGYVVIDDTGGTNAYPSMETSLPTYEPQGFQMPITAVALGAGAGGTIVVTVPCADVANVTMNKIVYSGIISTGPGINDYNAVGGLNDMPAGAGASVTPGFEGTGDLPVPGSADIALPAPSGGGAGPNNPIYNATNSDAVTNPPIIFSSTSNSIVSQEQGDSAVYTAINSFATQNHSDLSLLYAGLAGDFAGLSNELRDLGNSSGTNGSGTNGGLSITNYAEETSCENFTNWSWNNWTNAVAFTNLDAATMSKITNGAFAFGAAFSNDFESAGSLLPGTVGSLEQAPADITVATITAGTYSFPFKLSISSLPPAGTAALAALKILLAALAWGACYYLLFEELKECSWKVLFPGQISGTQQEFAGFNASLPSAAVYITIFSTLFLGFVVGGAALVTHAGSVSQVTDLMTNLSNFPSVSGAAWGWVTYAVPIQDIVSAVLTYWVSKFLIMNPAAIAVAAIVKVMPT